MSTYLTVVCTSAVNVPSTTSLCPLLPVSKTRSEVIFRIHKLVLTQQTRMYLCPLFFEKPLVGHQSKASSLLNFLRMTLITFRLVLLSTSGVTLMTLEEPVIITFPRMQAHTLLSEIRSRLLTIHIRSSTLLKMIHILIR